MTSVKKMLATLTGPAAASKSARSQQPAYAIVTPDYALGDEAPLTRNIPGFQPSPERNTAEKKPAATANTYQL